MFTWDDVIDVALGIEQAGEELYRQAAEAIDDPTISEALIWLADEEARHQKWFARLRAQQPAAAPTSKMEKISRALMRDMAQSQAQFHQLETLIKAKNLMEILSAAREAEKETARFYELIAIMLESAEDRSQIEVIITEEYRHAEILETWLKEGRLPETPPALTLPVV